jgi:hypothetical protein
VIYHKDRLLGGIEEKVVEASGWWALQGGSRMGLGIYLCIKTFQKFINFKDHNKYRGKTLRHA